jgi:hypothetical protein
LSSAVPPIAAVPETRLSTDPMPVSTISLPSSSAQVAPVQSDHTSAGGFNQAASTAAPRIPEPLTPLPVVTNVARLVEHASQAEMHIGMSTESFGGVTVHASIRDNHVGVAIGSERGDLANFFIRDDSGLKEALTRQSVHLDDVRFFDLSGSGAGFSDNRNRPDVVAPPSRLTWRSLQDSTSDPPLNEAQPLLSRWGLSVLA